MVLNVKKHRSEQAMGQFDQDKQAIVKCARWLSEHGYFGCVRGSGGNISVKLNRQNMMAITPSRRPYQELSVDDICVVDTQMKSIEGHLTPSIEATMHLSVYNSRPDVHAVIHAHPVFASILSIINEPIPALFDEITFEIGAQVDVIAYAVSGSADLAQNVTSKLGNHCYCYILENHGAISLGKSLDQAWKNTELLEKAAQIYYYALTTGRKITTLPEDAVQQIYKMRTST
jgi:ribulose-5-phosphate 4-epimerase/fuculose-1-phosphate aldolase